MRSLTEPLTPAQMDAARAVLERRGLRSRTTRSDLLSIMMCLIECDTDTYVDVAAEVHAAVREAGGYESIL